VYNSSCAPFVIYNYNKGAGRERNGAPKSNVFTSGCPVSNPLNLALIIQCLSRNVFFFFKFYILLKMSSRTPEGTLPQVEDHWSGE
jgi:hypothetical protein